MKESEYRGYVIRKLVVDGGVEILDRTGYRMTTCGSYWSAITYIDELLSP